MQCTPTWTQLVCACCSCFLLHPADPVSLPGSWKQTHTTRSSEDSQTMLRAHRGYGPRNAVRSGVMLTCPSRTAETSLLGSGDTVSNTRNPRGRHSYSPVSSFSSASRYKPTGCQSVCQAVLRKKAVQEWKLTVQGRVLAGTTDCRLFCFLLPAVLCLPSTQRHLRQSKSVT